MVQNAERALQVVQEQTQTKAGNLSVKNIARRIRLLTLASDALTKKAFDYTLAEPGQHDMIVSVLRNHLQRKPSGSASEHGITASPREEENGMPWREFAFFLNELAARIPDEELDAPQKV